MNERPLHVRPNLLKSILDVGSNHYEPWFWIDDLCIDQHNMMEGNHQV
jgi:hypothetical protein